MSLAAVIAAATFVGVIAYALLGGASSVPASTTSPPVPADAGPSYGP